MIVVADTSPLNYLVLIAEIELLPHLYERILIPEAVHRELQRLQTPSTVRTWAGVNSIPESVTQSSSHWKPTLIRSSWTKSAEGGKRFAGIFG